MSAFRTPFPWAICLCTIVLAGCGDDTQSPASRPEPPQDQGGAAGSMLRPVDLVYICGNKFLATNATPSAVHVVYHVVGTEERGSLDLRPGRSEQDQAHSETELQTVEKGTVELYVNDERVSRRPNEGRVCGTPAFSPAFDVVGDPATVGSWAAPFSTPIVSLHLSLLPDGRVLSWGHAGVPQVWDPATGNFTAVPSPSLLFCAGQTFLPDGRLLVTGGHLSDDHGLPDINLFSSGSTSWSTSTPMARGRWYPTNTMLANGDVVIMAGADENGLTVPLPEIWSRGSVRQLTGASRLFPYYPRTFLAPDGRIYYAGEEQTTRWLDPTGVGSWTTASSRLYGIRDYGAAVMYDQGKILYVGGGRTTNTAEIADINSGSPTWQWTGSMQFARRHLNATMLPTGEVLVTGGVSGTGFNDVTTTAVHAAEVWNPQTGVWTTLASNVKNRGYHATSILLPDGRVLHTGSGDGANAPSELNAEIFSPPYLFKGTRPSISSVPSIIAYGTTFSISTPDADAISKISFIRIGSTTHAFDANQRFQWLSFSHGSGTLTVTAPTDRNVTPLGHYLIFILDANGVPSRGKIVRMGTDADLDPPTNQPPAADFTSSCTGLTCNFTDQSFDSDGNVTGWSWTFGDGGTSTAQNPSRTYASAGTYTVKLTVTDNDGATQQRTASVQVGTTAISLNVTGSTDATKQYMTLKWTGATGSTVDVYRDGTFIKNTANTGKYVNSRNLPGSPVVYVQDLSRGIDDQLLEQRHRHVRWCPAAESAAGARFHLELQWASLHVHGPEHRSGWQRHRVELDLRRRRALDRAQPDPHLRVGRDVHRQAHRDRQQWIRGPEDRLGDRLFVGRKLDRADRHRVDRRDQAIHDAQVDRRDGCDGGCLPQWRIHQERDEQREVRELAESAGIAVVHVQGVPGGDEHLLEQCDGELLDGGDCTRPLDDPHPSQVHATVGRRHCMPDRRLQRQRRRHPGAGSARGRAGGGDLCRLHARDRRHGSAHRYGPGQCRQSDRR